jgi:hypothetical protein
LNLSGDHVQQDMPEIFLKTTATPKLKSGSMLRWKSYYAAALSQGMSPRGEGTKSPGEHPLKNPIATPDFSETTPGS